MLNALVPSYVGYDHEPQRRTIAAGTTLFHATRSLATKPLDPTELHATSYFSIDPRHPAHVLLEFAGSTYDAPAGQKFHPMLFEFLVIRDIPPRFQQEGDDPACEFFLSFPARRTDYLRHVRTFHLDAIYISQMARLGTDILPVTYAVPGFDDVGRSSKWAPNETPHWLTSRMTSLGVCEDIMCAPVSDTGVAFAADRQPVLDGSLRDALDRCSVTVTSILAKSTLTSYLLLRQLQERFGATRPLASALAAVLAAADPIDTHKGVALGETVQFYTFTSTEHVHAFTEDITYLHPDDGERAPISEMPEVRLLAHVQLSNSGRHAWFEDRDILPHHHHEKRVEAAILGLALADEDETEPELEKLAIEFCIRVLLYVRYHRRTRQGMAKKLGRLGYVMYIPEYVPQYRNFAALRAAAVEHGVDLIWDDGSSDEEGEDAGADRPAPDGESPLKRARLEQRAKNSFLY